MMDTIQKFDILPKTVLESLLDYYYSVGQYDTETMNKAPIGPSLNIVGNILEEILGKKLELTQGNFYKHTVPYLPHTDYKTYNPGSINVVIPLQYKVDMSHLIIFDQEWDLDSVTWCMHYPVQYFQVNIGVKGAPYEYPIKNSTKKEIDNSLYAKYLDFYPKHTLFGLSGKPYPFEPGSIIIFNNQKIHCTSSMPGEKIGLTLRFR